MADKDEEENGQTDKNSTYKEKKTAQQYIRKVLWINLISFW